MNNTEDLLLKETIEKIEYTLFKDVLVKTLSPIRVEKPITEQIPTGELDEMGYQKYDTKTEIKEVDSDWSIGVVLQIPESCGEQPFKVGDTILYKNRMAQDFDLMHSTQLVRPYDIIGKHNR